LKANKARYLRKADLYYWLFLNTLYVMKRNAIFQTKQKHYSRNDEGC